LKIAFAPLRKQNSRDSFAGCINGACCFLAFGGDLLAVLASAVSKIKGNRRAN